MCQRFRNKLGFGLIMQKKVKKRQNTSSTDNLVKPYFFELNVGARKWLFFRQIGKNSIGIHFKRGKDLPVYHMKMSDYLRYLIK